MQRRGGMGGSRIHCNFALHQLSTLFQKFVRARVEKDQGKKVVFVVVPLFCGSLQLVVEPKLFFCSHVCGPRQNLTLGYNMAGIFI